MSKHTPGPWKASHNSWEVSVIYAPCGEIARVIIDSEADDETQSRFEAIKEANARLMAAAPDLLEALRGMLALDEEHHQRDADDEDVCKEVKAARAAIAKATGSKYESA